MTSEASRHFDLLKELLEVQQKLAAANREHAFLLDRVATLENALCTPKFNPVPLLAHRQCR
jgi:hypothetical protein